MSRQALTLFDPTLVKPALADAFRKLEIKTNSLMYLPLQLAPEQQYNDESLRALLNLPKKKVTP